MTMKELNNFYRYFESLNEIERENILNRLNLADKILTSDKTSLCKELLLNCLYLNKEHSKLMIDKIEELRKNDTTI